MKRPAKHAEVRVSRWEFPRIEVTAQLQAPWGWRVESEQDDAGVYFVARRRPGRTRRQARRWRDSDEG